MIMPGTASTGKPWVSKPHSGQGRCRTQVQSLVSGMIVMPACYPAHRVEPWDHRSGHREVHRDPATPFTDRGSRGRAGRPAGGGCGRPAGRSRRRWPTGRRGCRWPTCGTCAGTGRTATTGGPAEARLNALPLFQTEIDGLRHRVRARPLAAAGRAAADPDPWLARFGGRVRARSSGRWPTRWRTAGEAADAFHVVCPSLPGYGFSGKPDRTGWGVERIARAWAELMARLGLPAVRGGGQRLGHQRQHACSASRTAAHVAGIHLVPPLAGARPGDVR